LIEDKSCERKFFNALFGCAAVFFLEFWKRKEVTIGFHWDVLEFEEEEVYAWCLLLLLNDDDDDDDDDIKRCCC